MSKQAVSICAAIMTQHDSAVAHRAHDLLFKRYISCPSMPKLRTDLRKYSNKIVGENRLKLRKRKPKTKQTNEEKQTNKQKIST